MTASRCLALAARHCRIPLGAQATGPKICRIHVVIHEIEVPSLMKIVFRYKRGFPRRRSLRTWRRVIVGIAFDRADSIQKILNETFIGKQWGYNQFGKGEAFQQYTGTIDFGW